MLRMVFGTGLVDAQFPLPSGNPATAQANLYETPEPDRQREASRTIVADVDRV